MQCTKPVRQTTLAVPMTCQTCVDDITQALSKLDGTPPGPPERADANITPQA